jgi:hypothetical protein
MPPPTRLIDDGVDYSHLLQRIISLPAEIQMVILRPLLVVERPHKYDVRKALRCSYRPWLLVSKRLAPQVRDVFWKENTFPMMIRHQGKLVNQLKWYGVPTEAPIALKYKILSAHVAASIQSVVFRFEDYRVYRRVPEAFDEHLEYLAFLGEAGRFPRLRRLKIVLPQELGYWQERITHLRDMLKYCKGKFSSELELDLSWDLWWSNHDLTYPASVEALRNVDWAAVLNKLNSPGRVAGVLRVWEIEGLVRKWLLIESRAKWEAIWEVIRTKYVGRCAKEKVPWRVKPTYLDHWSRY